MTGEAGATGRQKEPSMEKSKVQFVLKGFSEVLGCRIFAFDCVAADRTRSAFTVSIDLGLSRRYGIRLQELPLLCRAVLERPRDGEERREFAYTEQDMGVYADCAAARKEAERSRKPARRPQAVIPEAATAAAAPAAALPLFQVTRASQK
jgi:hypothetical protein